MNLEILSGGRINGVHSDRISCHCLISVQFNKVLNSSLGVFKMTLNNLL